MTYLRQRMTEDLQLHGYVENTQRAYLQAVSQLAAYYHKSPDEINEEELRQYFLYLVNEKKVARSTYGLAISGIKFFYQYTLNREWPTFKLLKAPREKKLPIVLSQDEVRRILDSLYRFKHRACLSTIYGCGLRVGEALRLEVPDIDSERMLLHVRRGKGSKDRYVPLPREALSLLRQHWSIHRHSRLIFPSQKETNNGHKSCLSRSSVLEGLKKATKACEIQKAVTTRTLRHSYATHLLENGVSLRVIQAYLGHSSIASTMIYTHLTKPIEERVIKTINGLLADIANLSDDSS